MFRKPDINHLKYTKDLTKTQPELHHLEQIAFMGNLTCICITKSYPLTYSRRCKQMYQHFPDLLTRRQNNYNIIKQRGCLAHDWI